MPSSVENQKRSILGIIPSRGGSKTIPRKNIKEFLGKPLLVWTIEVAKESKVFDRLILSTEDEEIAETGRVFGAEVPFLRPPELAQDATPTAPVVRHAVEWLRVHNGWTPEFVMVLEPTSPGRRAFHLREATALLQTSGGDSVASISEVPHHYAPVKLLKLHGDGMIHGIDGTPVRNMIHRRQDLPPYYGFDGLLYACKAELLMTEPPTLWGEKVIGYVVDSKYSVDLDRPEDWAAAEAKLREILCGEEL
jgi:CMP-N,N'-diacetyllegionaminic acid synthase